MRTAQVAAAVTLGASATELAMGAGPGTAAFVAGVIGGVGGVAGSTTWLTAGRKRRKAAGKGADDA
jgi:hypothetical protein